ncbi:hypothetical protein [Marinococcus luteus]
MNISNELTPFTNTNDEIDLPALGLRFYLRMWIAPTSG